MLSKFYSCCLAALLFCFSLQAAPAPPCNLGANVNPGSPTICEGQSQQLSATPTGTRFTYVWSNGATTATISVSPTTNTTYSVTVTDTVANCFDVSSSNVTVRQNPVGTITPSTTAVVCARQSVTLTASSSLGGSSFHWSNNSNNASITVNPTATTTYTVTVTRNGCTDVVSHTVAVNTASLAGLFTNCNAVTVAPYTISLSDASSPNTGITNYRILWGDTGVAYNSSTPPSSLTHTYGGGSFNLTYIITRSSGCIDTGRFTVRNLTNPSLAIGSPGNTLGCGPLPLCFPILNVSNNDASTTYLVDYGDYSAQQSYNQPPPDTICHTYVLASCGAPGIPNSVFLPNNWFYSITATNACGTTAGAIGGIQVYTSPVARFTLAANPVCVTNAVSFTNTSDFGYYANCDSSAIFTWYFGDGDSQIVVNSKASVTHIYASPGSYNAVLKASNQCGNTTFTQTVCIVPPVVAGFTLNNTVGCIPFTVNATNTTSPLGGCSPPTYNWTVTYVASPPCGSTSNWSFSGGTSAASQDPVFVFSTPGTYTITLAATNVCGTTTTSRTVTVKQPPLVSLTPITSSCTPYTISPSSTVINCGTTAMTYAWTSVPAGFTSSAAVPPATVFSTTGVNTINLAVTNECGTTNASTSFNVSAQPTVAVPANTTVCPGASVPGTNLASTPAGATYTWTNSNTGIGLGASGSGDVPSFTATNTTGATITGTITVTPNLNGCVGIPSTYTVSVYPNPTAGSLPANPSVCGGASIPATNFTSNPPGGTFNWTNSNTNIGLGSGGSGNVPTFTGTNTGSSAITGTIAVTATLNGCTGPASTYTITINPAPTVNVPAPVSVCPNVSVPASTFTSTPPGGTFTWTNDNTGTGLGASGSGSTPVFTSTNGGSTPITSTVTVTPTVNGCAGTPSSFTITVNPRPSVTAPTLPPNSTVCPGASVPATNFASNPPGATYTWTNSNTGIGLPASGSGNIPGYTATNGTGGAISGTITVTPSVNGCAGNPSSFIVTVSPSPVANTPSSVTVCPGASVPASNFTTTPAGGTFTWTNSNPSIGLPASGTGNTPVFTAANPGSTAISGTITVTATVAGCTGSGAGYTITISPPPSITAPANDTVCPGATVPAKTFTSTPPGATYTWTNSNPAIGLAASGSGTVPAFTAANPTTTPIQGTITVTPSLGGCAGPPITFIVVVRASAAVVPNPNVAVCVGATVPASNFTSNPAGATFTWTNSNNAIGLGGSGVGNVPSFTATNSTSAAISGTITVVANSGGCPGSSSSYTITVTPVPVVTVPSNIVRCAGATVAATTFTSTPAGATYTWVNDNTAIGLAASGTGNVPLFTTTNPGLVAIAGNITVTPTLNGCPGPPATYSITVNPLPTVTLPPSDTVCPGTVVAATNLVSVPAGATYAWTNSNVAIGLAASGTGNVPAFVATNASTALIVGIVRVTPTLNGCPGTQVAFNHSVYPTPTTTVPANASVCSGATVAASNFVSTPAGATFTWTNNNPAIGLPASGAGNTPSFTATNTGTTVIVGTITVTPTLNGCPGTPSSYSISVKPLPVIAPLANDTLCAGATEPQRTLITVPSGSTFAWTNTNTLIGLAASGTGNVPAFTTTNNTGATISGTITATPTLNLCAGAPVSYVVVVNISPTVTVPANISVCTGATIPATSFSSVPAGATYTWTNSNPAIGLPSNGTGDIPSFTGTNSTAVSISGTISVVGTNGCSGPPATYTITINPPPTVTATANRTACAGSTVSATTFTSVPAGATFDWTNSNTAIGLAASGTGSVPAFTAINATGSPITANITVTPNLNGCAAGTPSVYAITINPLPTVTVPANDSVCPVVFVPATAFTSSPAGATYTWTNSNTSTGLSLASGSGNVPAFASANSTTAAITSVITVTPRLNGCNGTPTPYSIVVRPNPTVTVPAAATYCNGATVPAATFTSTPVGATFTWTNTNPNIGIAASGTGNIPSFTANNPGLSVITATITVTPNLNGCDGTPSSYNITVRPRPFITAPADDTVCAGTVVPASTFFSIPAGATYAWTNSNTGIGLAASGTGAVPAFTSTNATTGLISGTITVTPTLNTCTGNPITFVHAVSVAPTMSTPANIAVCSGATIPASSFTSPLSGTTFNWTNSNNGIGLAASGTGDIAAFTATNSTNAVITATITVTPVNGCPGPAVSYTITVYPPPVVNVPVSYSRCAGATVTLTSFTSTPTGSTYAWTNNNTAIGLAASGTGSVPAFTAINATTAPVVATITVTPTLAGCPGVPSSYDITINPRPTVTAPVTAIVCPGTIMAATALVSTPPGATYTWTNNNVAIGLGSSGTGDVPAYTSANPTAATITATINITPTLNGCAGTAVPYTQQVYANPTATIPANVSVCVGGTVAATNFTSTPAGGTFTWTNSNTAIGLAASGTGNIPAFTSTNATTASIIGTITVTPTVNGCVGNPSNYTITVKPIPTITLPPSDTICPGVVSPVTAFISVPAGATYAWTNSNTAIGLGASGTGNVPAFTGTNATTAAIAGTITVTPTLNLCAGTPVTYVKTINPRPTVTVPSNIAVCSGVTIPATTFTSNLTGTTYSWTNSNNAIGLAGSGSGDVPAFTATNTGSAAISSTITVTPVNSNGCTGVSSSYTITVNPAPTVNVPANTTRCAGATVAASAFTSVPAGATYAWTNSNTGIGLAASGTGNVPAFTTTNATAAAIVATITVTPTLNSCPGTPVTYTITVNPPPVVTVPVSDTTCPGTAIAGTNFTSSPPGASYTWTNNNTAIGLPASGVGDVPSFTSANVTTAAIVGTITVTPTLNGCAGTPIAFQHRVNPLPVVTAIPAVSVCVGATVSASNYASTPAGATYTWTNSNAAIGLATSGAGNIPAFTATNATQASISGTIFVTATLNGCTGNATSYTITVKPLPTVTLPPSDTICPATVSAATAFTSTPAGATYAWSNSNTAIGLGASGTGNVPAFTGINATSAHVTGTITVTPTLNLCVGAPVTYTKTIAPKPAAVVPANVAGCPGEVIPATVLSSLPAGATFTWSNNNTSIGLAASGTGDVPSFTATNPGSTVLTATITVTPVLEGCAGNNITFTYTISPAPTVTVPVDFGLCPFVVVPATNLTSNPAGATYTWTNSNPAIGLAASGTGNVPSFTTDNTTSGPISGLITVTPTLNGCVGTPATYTITVNIGPTVAAIPNDTICYGTVVPAVNFTSSPAGATYAWTNSNAAIGLAGSGTGGIPQFTAANTGSTIIQGTISITPTLNGCLGPVASYIVVVNPAPVALLPVDITVCPGDNVPASNFASTPVGATYVWTNSSTAIGLGPNGTGNVPPFTAVNGGATPLVSTINVTPTLRGCVGPARTYTITVNPSPIATVPVNDTLCHGQVIPATVFTSATAGATFSWTNSNTSIGLAASGTGNLPAFTATNLTVNPVVANFVVTTALNGCPGTPANFTYTVNPTPVVTVPSSTIVCFGDVIPATSFSSTLPLTTYGWTNSNTGIGLAASGTGDIAAFTTTNATNAPITGTITVTATTAGCPSQPADYSITVKPVPVVTITPSDDTICSATQFYANLSSNVPGTSISWTVNSPAGVSGQAAGTGDSILQVLANGSGTAQTVEYYVVSSVNGCNGLPDTVSVVVNPGVDLNFSTGIQTICSGQTTAPVYVTTTSGLPITWTSNANGITGVLASGTDSIPAQTLTNNTNLGVVVEYNFTTGYPGCPPVTYTYSVIVNPPSTAIQSTSQTICSGTSSQPIIINSNALGITYDWTATSPDGITGFTASGTSTVIPGVLLNNPNPTAGIVVYTITPGSLGCPGVPVNDTVFVNPVPVLDSLTPQTICSGATSVAVPLSSALPATYNWSVIYNGNITGFTASGTGNIPAQTLSNSGVTTDSVVFYITPSAGGCNGPSVNYGIVVSPFPDVILPATQSVCSGSSTTLAALTSNASGATFAWTATATPGVTGFTASGTGDIPAQVLSTTGTTAGSVTYAITPTASGCPGPVVNYVVGVKPIPTVVAAPDTICSLSQTNIILTSPVAGTTFTWTVVAPGTITGASAGSGAAIQQTLNSSSATTDSVIYSITPSAGGCPGPVLNVSAVVNPTTTVSFSGPNQNICTGQTTASVQITGSNPGGTYAWTSQANGVTGVLASGNDSIPAQTLVNNTNLPLTVIYTVNVGSGGACPSSPASYTIIVNPAPSVTASPGQTICSGSAFQPVIISANNNSVAFNWTGSSPDGITGFAASGTSAVIPSSILTNPNTTAGLVIYTITPNSSGCPGLPIADTIIVNPVPVIAAIPTQIICSNASSTLATVTSTPATTYNWSVIYSGNVSGFTASGTGDIPAQTLINNGLTTDSVTFNITAALGGCNATPVNFNVVVTPAPDVILPATQNICSGSTTILATISSSTAGATFAWTATASAGVTGFTANGTGDIPAETLSNSGATAGTVTYAITPTANGCPGPVINYVVTVKPIPTVVAAPDTICSLSQTNIILTSPVAGTTFTWTVAAPGTITGASAGSGATIQQTLNSSVATADSVIYSITPSAGGCVGPVLNVSAVVNPTTTVSFSAPDQSICSGQTSASVQITGSNPGGTYAWTSQANGAIGVTPSGNDSIPAEILINNSGVPVAVVYTVSTGGGSCPSNPASYVIIVNPSPTVNPNPAQTTCSGVAFQPIVITANTSGLTYSWTGTSPDGITGFTASGTGAVIPSSILTNPNTTAGIVVYTITPSSSGCPGLPITDTIIVNPIPVITPVPTQTICSGATSVLATVTTTPTTTANWTVIYNGNISGFTTSGTGDVTAQTLTNNGVTTDSVVYRITAALGGCNATPVNFNVVVTPAPDVILPATQSICSGATTTIAILSSNAAGATFAWSATATAGVTGFTANGTGDIPAETLSNSGTTAGTVTYAITPTANGCPGPVINYIVTVRPIPTVVAATDTICSLSQTNIVLTSPVAGTTFTWTVAAPGTITGASAGSGAAIQQTLNSSSATADSVIYTITPSAGGCVGPVLNVSAVVNPTTTVSFSAPDQSICSGQTSASVQITGSNPGGTYAWTSQANGALGVTASGNDSIPVQTLTNNTSVPIAVVYTVATGGGSCPSNPASYVIIVNPSPTVNPNPAQTTCSGVAFQPIVITANTSGLTYSWTGTSPDGITGFTASGTGAVIPSSILTNPNTTAGIVVYTITPSSSGCPGLPITDTIIVNPIPVITAVPTQTICSNASSILVNLTATPAGATLNWSVIYNGNVTGYTASGTTTIPAQILTNNGLTIDSVTYNITASLGGCNATPVNFNVVVTPAPDVILPAAQSICSGASTTVATLSSNAAGATFAWTATATAGIAGFTANGTGNIPAETLNNSTTTTGTVTYAITPTANGCPGPVVNYIVTVKPLPTVVAAPDTICSLGQTNIALTSPSAGATFTWTVAAPGTITGAAAGGGAAIQQTLSSSSVNADSVIYSITPTAGGCVGPVFTVSAVVNPATTVSFSAPNQTICSGQTTASVQLTGSNPGGTYAWTSTANGVTGVTASGNDSIPMQTLVNSSNVPVSVIYTVSNSGGGCSGNPATYTIIVNPTPAAVGQPTQTICTGFAYQPITLSSTTSGATYSWTGASPDGVTGFAASGTSSVIPSSVLTNAGNTTGTVVYTITPSVGACPGTSVNDTIFVSPVPVVTPIATQSICSGQSSTAVTLNSVPAGTYNWSAIYTGNITGFTASGNGNIPAQTLTNSVSTADSVVFNVTASTAGCTSQPVTFTVVVGPGPDVILPAAQNICSGATTNPVTISSNSGSATFTWTAAATAGVTGFTASGTGNIPAETLSNSGTTAGTVTYAITPSANSCPGTVANYIVTVKPTPTAVAAPDTICTNGQTNIAITSPVSGTTFSWVANAPGTITGANNGSGNSIQQTLSSTAASADSVLYIITPTAAGCVGPVTTVAAVVNPTTTLSFSAPDQSICSGQQTASIQITGSNSGTYAWTSQANGVIGVTASGNDSIPVQTLFNNGATPVAVIYTVNAGSGTCPGSPANYRITVNPVPTAIAPPAQTVCSGGSSQVISITTNISGSTLTWTGTSPNGVTGFSPSGTSSFVIPSQNVNLAGNTQGIVVYTITPSYAGCPGAPVNDTIIVNPTPLVNALTTQSICSGGTSTVVALAANIGGSTFNWNVVYNGAVTGYTASGTGNIPAQTLTNNGATADSVVYQITPSANGCAGQQANYSIVVTSPPTVILPSPQTICTGATTVNTVVTSATAGATFSWTATATAGVTGFTASGTGDIPAQTITNTGNTPGTVTYAVTPAANGCNGPVSNYVVTVNPAPVAAAADDTICPSAQTNIAITSTLAGTTYTWNAFQPAAVTGAANGSGNTIQQVLSNSSQVVQTVLYVITPSANGCVGPVDSVYAVVNPSLAIQFNPGPQTICTGQSTQTVFITGSGVGASFAWTSQANGVTGVITSGTDSIPVQTLVNSSNFPLTVNYNVSAGYSGCPNSVATYSVVVNPAPVATSTPAQTVCSGTASQAITLNSNVSNATYSWSGSSPNGVTGFTASGTSSVIPSQNLTNAGTTTGVVVFTITPTAAGCPGTPVNDSIFVNPLPVINPIPTQTICSGSTTTAVTPSSNVSGATFTWNAVYAGNITGFTPSGTGNITAQTLTNLGLTADSVVFNITAATGNCNSPAVTFAAVVNPGPDVILPAAQNICSGATTLAVTLASNTAGATFSWTATATANVTGFTASGTGNLPAETLTNTGNTAGTVTYAITATGGSCPGPVYNCVVTVKPQPVTTVTPATATICSGTQVNFALSSSFAGATFSWTYSAPAGVIGAANGTGNSIQQLLDNTTATPQTVTYTITASAIGCPGPSVTADVIVNPVADVVFILPTQSVCSGATSQAVTISSGVNGATFNWTSQANGATGVAASGTNTIPAQTLGNAGNTFDTVVYTVVADYQTCPGQTATYLIVVNPIPVVNLPAPQTVCSGVATNPATLGSNVAGATYTWTGSSPDGITGFIANGTTAVIPSQTLTNPNATAGQVIYAVTPLANTCPGTPANYVITVSPAPDVILPQPQTICSGNTSTAVTLASAVSGTTFTWTSTAGAAITGNITSGAGDIHAQALTNSSNQTDTVTFVITPSASACPGQPATYQIEVLPQPVVAFAPQAQTICSGQTSLVVSLTSATNGASIAWTATVPSGVTGAATSGTNTIPAQTLFNNSVNVIPTPLTVIYTAVATAGVCTGPQANYAITVNPIPTVDFIQNIDSGCSPLGVAFTPVTTNYNLADSIIFNWGDGSANTVLRPNPLLPAWFSTNHTFGNNTNAIITYNVSMIAKGACIDTTITNTVTVLPASTNAAFTASPLNGCAPLTVTLTDQSTGPGILAWCFDYNTGTGACNGAGQVNTTGATFTHVFPAGTHTIALYATSSFGCANDTAFATVNVTPSPVVDFTFSNVGCAKTPVQFTSQSTVPVGTSVTAFDWSFGTGDVSPIANPVYLFDTGGVYNVCLKVTTNTGCFDSVCKPVSVLYKPVAAFVSLDTCVNKQPILFANNSTGATGYQWSFGDGNISNLSNPANQYGAAGTYSVTLISYNSACSDTITQAVTVYPIPVAAFTVPGPYSCGIPSAIQVTNTSTNAGGYFWDFGNGSTSTATNPVINYTAQGNYPITLVASNRFGCYDTAQSAAQVYAYPQVNAINISPSQGCEPLDVNFAANTVDGNNFVWRFGDGTPDESGAAVTSHTYTTAGTYTVTLQVGNFGTCADTITLVDTIVVHPIPVAGFDYTMSEEIDSAIGLVQFINTSTNSTTYAWNFGDGDTSDLVNPSHLFPEIDRYTVTLVATSEFGCRDSVAKDIYIIKKSLYVPNAFAPEYNAGNGLVRVWQPVGMGIKDYHAQIFNTWGELLWESYELTADYHPAEGWDGTYQGKLVQQDVYVWKIEAVFIDGTRWKGMSYRGGPRKSIGDVTLIR